MTKLNLEATSREHEIVKAYLEDNASETLAEKINNGTPVEKDGKQLINRKTLDGFMRYACDEARKLAAKGASSAASKTRSCSAGRYITSKKTASKARFTTPTARNTNPSAHPQASRRTEIPATRRAREILFLPFHGTPRTHQSHRCGEAHSQKVVLQASRNTRTLFVKMLC